jgi:hypothetical protein
MLNKTLRTLLAAALATGAFALHAATLEIVNANEPGVGFNDPTPVAPVNGNNGKTLGEQRLNVFKFAAKVWGDKLKSNVKIQILSALEPLECDANRAVLGFAGPIQVFSDFPNAPLANTWYPVALANKLAKQDLAPGEVVTGDEADIGASFNSELGKPGCLEGGGFYLGLDGKPPSGQVDFASTVLHEFGHGLGFLQATVDETTGERFEGLADVWEQYLYDNTLRKTWLNMTNEERVFSAVNARQLVWNGPHVQAQVPNVLERGADELFIAGANFDRFMLLGAAEFGPAFSKEAVTGSVVPVKDTAGATTACVPLATQSVAKVKGNVALIDRGGCAFPVQVKNAQDAGAKAVLIADNVAGSPPPDLGGDDDGSIKIVSARISLEDGRALRKAANKARNVYAGPISVLFKNQLRYSGADAAGRPLIYSPNPYEGVIAHYGTSAKPNLLMEPFATGDDPLTVSAPRDLSLELLRDIGW